MSETDACIVTKINICGGIGDFMGNAPGQLVLVFVAPVAQCADQNISNCSVNSTEQASYKTTVQYHIDARCDSNSLFFVLS